MTVLFNFLDKHGIETYNALLEWLNNPNTSNLNYLSQRLGVTPARVSQWVHHFFTVEYKPTPKMEEWLKVYIEVKRQNLNRAEESTHHTSILRLVNESDRTA